MTVQFDSTRRAAVAATVLAPFAVSALVRGATTANALQIGVIGCGGRGTGAALDALAASSDVRIVALADLFRDKVDACRGNLAKEASDRAAVEPARCFDGFDAYQKLLATDVDIVILATPPGFRPIHFAAAVDAGKNIFMEKPCAVDGPGIRLVMEKAKVADAKKLCVVAGTQRRSQPSYIAAMERLHRGDLGRLVAGRCYWNQGGLWNVEANASKSDVENQIRNWLYHSWLSGDHIVEQHVHQLDVMNWGFGRHPALARGVGGRQSRTEAKFGHIYDHFGVEYVYPAAKGQEAFGDAFVLSMCRQQDGTVGRVEEVITGSDGLATLRPGSAEFVGAKKWTFDGPNPNPYVEEHKRLQEAVRAGQHVNEATQVAESTLTAILGRMAAYSGEEVTWDQALNSNERLMPEVVEFGSRPVAPVAIPGKTKIG
ncbi:MAG: Gfo/Idh/MocA family oxidoreductase [Phycisphaerae bacterium]|nr:Gfo/Idh/MocA family oxidoreductase [Phycisphaerae bacterium]